MKVSEIEVHQITLEYHDWIAYEMNHYHGPNRRTICIAHTDTGLVGLGEGRVTQEDIDRYIGTNPFDWLGDETSLTLGTAMYDLMGQAAGVPVYKLFGQKQRSWVPVASWTVSTHPERMAAAVQHHAAAGYTWMKYHLSPFENVFDQTEAMQAVAPEGFKIHYDFTGGGTYDLARELLAKLEKYPIAGCFEDPIDERDLEGLVQLCRQVQLPIFRHRAPLGATYELMMGSGSGRIEGHSKLADAIRAAGLCAAGNVPLSIQHVGGNITRAMNLHMHAAFPTGYIHFNNDSEIWSSDVVEERLEPINGFVRVPEEPGLGVTLDRDELERLAKLELPDPEPWILRSRFKNGTTMYIPIASGKGGHFFVRPDWTKGLIPMSYDSPIASDYWDNDDSADFAAMWERLEREELVIERA
jgi:L-alanine-DL-glutamate epimerase-like enolase superfamily enzyme